MIGKRIKQARIAAGLSLRELSKRTDNYVTAQAISKYENNRSIPGTDVFSVLAKGLDVNVDYFFQPYTVNVQLSKPVYRKRPVMKMSTLNSIQDQVRDKLEKYIEVEELFPDNDLNKFTIPDIKIRTIKKTKDTETFAQHLRDKWNLGTDPIMSMTHVLENNGVKVVMVETNESIDGLSCWANKHIPVIVVNKSFPTDRIRFSIAHELGHLLMNVKNANHMEKAANRFAGAFLVPDDVAKSELGDKRKRLQSRELVLIREKYGMSVQAWIHRARELAIISDRYAASLFRYLRKINLYDKEMGNPLYPEIGRRFELLVYRAVEEKLISKNKGAELLNISLQEYE